MSAKKILKNDIMLSPICLSNNAHDSIEIGTDPNPPPTHTNMEVQTDEPQVKKAPVSSLNYDWAKSEIYLTLRSTILDKDQPISDNLASTTDQIYTEVEATYKASLLRKKAFNNPENLLEFHSIAKNTLSVLTKNMISAD